MSKEYEVQESQLVVATREHFTRTISEGDPVHQFFPHHVRQVEKWASRILEFYPEADREVVLLAVWLHDIGHTNKANMENHEIYSEQEARVFLPTLGLPEERIDMVAHCVRTHRCKPDALPETIEAKVLAAADSASHMTDIVYIYMLNDGISKVSVLDKLERDIRDTQSIPEPLQEQLIPLQTAWRELISVFPE